MSLARQLQRNILPRSLPDLPGLEFGALMVPAQAVGGDFYDVTRLDGDRIGIVVGDVSDKGMPAALYMSLTFSLLKVESRRHASPEAALQAVNRLLIEMDISDMFVSVLYGIYRQNSREFSYARAGHPPPILLQPDGKASVCSAQLGQTLGILEDLTLDQNRIRLSKGSGLLVYSDGLTEPLNSAGEQFGAEGVFAVLQSLNGASAQQVCDRLHQAVSDFSGSENPQDDVTLVYVRFD
jgi:serine phosphatase RsbU (regulator of sigma subunit)